MYSTKLAERRNTSIDELASAVVTTERQHWLVHYRPCTISRKEATEIRNRTNNIISSIESEIVTLIEYKTVRIDKTTCILVY
jgi:hypothetical protein